MKVLIALAMITTLALHLLLNPAVAFSSVCHHATVNTKLGLFDLFKSKNPGSQMNPLAKKDETDAKLAKAYKLEKISNKQSRDWAKESEKLNKKKEVRIDDKQPRSYNYKKANELPNLYRGWIKADGDQIAKQMISAVKASLAKKEKLIEVIFDPVPNLDEVTYGTPWNLKFRKEVNANLKVTDAATKRSAPSVLEWSNIYWANRLVAGIGAKNVVTLSISGEGTGKVGDKYVPTLSNGMKLITFNEGKKVLKQPGDASLIILLSPVAEGQYREAEKLGMLLNCPIICLNSAYSYRYDIGAGTPWTLAYVMKRIPKGWIFRIYPGKFDAIVEGPDYEITRTCQYEKQPKLTEISKANQKKSAELYGPTGNDRIFENRL